MSLLLIGGTLFGGAVHLVPVDFSSTIAALAMLLSFRFSVLGFRTEGGIFEFLAEWFERSRVISAVMTVCFFLFFYCLFCCVRSNLRSFQGVKVSTGKQKQHWFFWLCAVVSGILLLQYATFFPFGKSPDSLQQWDQIHGLVSYNTIHAIGHTFFLKVLLSLWDSYAIVVVVQIIAVLALYLWFGKHFLDRLQGFFVLTVIALSLVWMTAATPALFYPWKDAPEACCLMVVTILIAELQEQQCLSLLKAGMLGAALAWCSLFRLNGAVATICCTVFFISALIRRGLRKQLAVMLLTGAVSVAGVLLYSNLVLQPVSIPNGFGYQVFGSGIASAVSRDELSEEERTAIEELLPVEWMEEYYVSPYQKQPLFWTADGSENIQNNPNLALMNNDFVLQLGRNGHEVVRLYLKLFQNHSRTMLQDLLGNWSCVFLQNHLYFVATHLFQSLLLFFLVIRLKTPFTNLAVFLPALCNTVSIMISTVTNEMRYLLPTFLIFPFLVLYLLNVHSRTGEEVQLSRERI